MLTTIKNIRRTMAKNRLAALLASIPKLSASEQTRMSWAKPIRSLEDVPVVFMDVFKSFLSEEQPFPYTVLTPSYEGFLRRATEKLVSVIGNVILILERNGNTIETQSYPIDGISYVETRTVLLDSYFKISGQTNQGIPTTSILRYNAVTDYLFTPFLQAIRPAVPASMDTARDYEKFDAWISVNFKFMNYARRSLLIGEKVIQAILQPEIRADRFTLFGKTYTQLVSPTQVCILTDRELILIREEVKLSGHERYGGVWDYIPHNKIERLSLEERENGLLAVSIHLPANKRLECVFQQVAKDELEQLLDGFHLKKQA